MKLALKNILFLLFILIQIFFLKECIIGFYRVDTNSMSPNIKKGDIVLVSKAAYRILGFSISEPEKNQVIVFNKNGKKNLKRIAAIGEKKIYFDSKEVFLNNPDHQVDSVSISKNEIFVVGDNFTNSYDSRFYGGISYDSIIGKYLFKI